MREVSAMRVLLDTNIVFDMLCKRPFDKEGLLQLKIMHAFGDVDLWVSAKSYTDLFYVMRRELESPAAQTVLEESLDWLKVCSVDGDDIRAALEPRWHDFEDSLVNVCAEKVKADYLITRDDKGFRNTSIPHGGASDFMSFVRDKTGVSYAIAEEQ